jgi:hypothetical protein
MNSDIHRPGGPSLYLHAHGGPSAWLSTVCAPGAYGTSSQGWCRQSTERRAGARAAVQRVSRAAVRGMCTEMRWGIMRDAPMIEKMESACVREPLATPAGPPRRRDTRRRAAQRADAKGVASRSRACGVGWLGLPGSTAR